MIDFQAELMLSLPFEILSVGALGLLLAEVTFKGQGTGESWSRGFATGVILVLAMVGAVATEPMTQTGQLIFSGLVYADPFANFITFFLLVASFVALLLGMQHLQQQGVDAPSEYYALFLMTTAGAIVFVTAAELITFFLGLEIMSMGLYCLCGAALKERRSSESALKYFLLGSFSSAILLYGIALLYGLSGTTSIPELASSLGGGSTMLLLALGLVLVGLAFKISAVPFHFWAPDVYQGAPTPVTAYMACVVKGAAVAATLRILWVTFGKFVVFWSGLVWLLALLTMVFGNLIALRQRSVKRMLAYSSIAHAGYILVGFLAPSNNLGVSVGGDFGGGPAIMYYLVAYTVMTLGAFGVLLAVTSRFSESGAAQPDDISRFYGLSSREPMLAAAMALFMLSLAGLPPGMAGLLGKFYIFNAAIKAHYTGLAIIGVLASAVSCYYYLRVIVAMYFMEGSSTEEKPVKLFISPSLAGSLALCAIGVLYFGLFPSTLFELSRYVTDKL